MLEQSVRSQSSYLNLFFSLLLIKITLGIRENLLVRINQQVTIGNDFNYLIGTSETTRKAFSYMYTEQSRAGLPIPIPIPIYASPFSLSFSFFPYIMHNLHYVGGVARSPFHFNGFRKTKQLPYIHKHKHKQFLQASLPPSSGYTDSTFSSVGDKPLIVKPNSPCCFDFSDYIKQSKKQPNNIDFQFLAWFVGFLEAEGERDAFGRATTNNPVHQDIVRADFEIVQSITNIKLLYYIRKKLDFGRVTIFEKAGLKYCKWFTSKKENILLLISILNGNLLLEKRRIQFQNWLGFLNTYWSLNIYVKPCFIELSLDNAWLSGFSDADAGFYTSNNFVRGKLTNSEDNYVFFVQYYITQDGELNLLHRLQSLIGDSTKINLITNGRTKKKYNRLSITKMECIEKLKLYFNKFPLHGVRIIDYLRWVRVFGYKQRGVVLTEHSAKKLARLVNNLQPAYLSDEILLNSEEEDGLPP